jgi:hypothetical protein
MIFKRGRKRDSESSVQESTDDNPEDLAEAADDRTEAAEDVDDADLAAL